MFDLKKQIFEFLKELVAHITLIRFAFKGSANEKFSSKHKARLPTAARLLEYDCILLLFQKYFTHIYLYIRHVSRSYILRSAGSLLRHHKK